MLKRLFTVLVMVPVGILLVTLAVINRHSVQLVLDPFRPTEPIMALSLPFYAYLFGSLLLGVLAGGFSVWYSQGHYRKTARTQGRAARRWQAEADRLTRERDQQVSQSKTLLTAGE